MASNMIGNLAVSLSLETAAFQRGASQAERILAKTQREFQKTGDKIKGIGDGMSKWITLPIIGAGAAVLKLAGDFEAGMGRVGISTQATAGEMAKMRDLALDIGKSTTMSASESADAMDMLAKAGLSASDILNGAARATVALAEAAGSGLQPAASVITDTMQQFNKTTKDLPNIINNVTGAVNESKFSFEDFSYGMAQGGGVAASAGLEFEEFTAALAATASQFASGQDAGTSMKTFLLSLTPATKKAREAMEEAGFSAYDLQGNLKPLAQIAQDLKDKFSNLSEADLNATFKEMFGTDAIRTAIGLMKQGADGITDMQARIAATDASAQAAQRMKGLNAEMEKLGGALETLAINIADSGLLSAITGIVTSIGEWVDYMAEVNPQILKWGTVIAGVVAVIGPLLIGVGSIVSAVGVMLPAIIAVGGALGTLASVIVAGALPAIGSLLVALSPILIPLGLVAAAVAAGYLAWKNWDKIEPILRNMYNGVKTWLLDKLGAVWKFITDKIETVRKAFYYLYDAVVGHSYVPDMVDGIRDQMARLDAVMVAPALKATQKVEQAFRDLQTKVQPILSKLFPDEGAANKYSEDQNILVAGAKAGIINADQLREALIRLRDSYFGTDGPQTIMKDEGFVENITDSLPELADVGKTTAQKLKEQNVMIVKSFADTARDVTSSITGLANSIKSGGILGILEGVANLFLSLGSAGVFGSKLQTNINKPVGRARGGATTSNRTYLVGERGPELFTSNRSGYITPNNKMNDAGRATTVNIVPTPYFDVVVDGRAQRQVAAGAPGIASAAAAGVQTNLQQANFRALP
jgi:TP901 family phage tail tape measure protein